MLIAGTALMGFWLFLVGGLQGGFGHWGIVDGSRQLTLPLIFKIRSDILLYTLGIWVITDHDAATKAIIVCSYFFVCSFAVTMGPVRTTLLLFPIQ